MGTVRESSSGKGWIFNVCDFGAKGDGSADDTDEIQAALTAAQAVTNALVYFPPGIYLCSNRLTYTNTSTSDYRRVCVRGEGLSSEIRFTSTVGSERGLAIDISGANSQFRKAATVQDLALTCTGTNADAGGTAVYIVQNDAASVIDAPVVLENLYIMPYTSNITTSYFEYGINIHDTWNTQIRNCTIKGENTALTNRAGATTGNMVACIYGTGDCMDLHVSQCNLWCAQYGIWMYTTEDNQEGIHITHNTCVGCDEGYRLEGYCYGAAEDSGNDTMPGVYLEHNHANCYSYGVFIKAWRQFHIDHNLIYQYGGSGSYGNFAGIAIDNTGATDGSPDFPANGYDIRRASAVGIIAHNILQLYPGTSTVYGIYINAGWWTHVVGNSIHPVTDGGTGIAFISPAKYGIITSNGVGGASATIGLSYPAASGFMVANNLSFIDGSELT